MDNWKTVIIKGMAPGALAGIASAGVLAACAKRETGSAFAGINAVSHCLWGDEAFRRSRASLRYTLVGYAIHHASAHCWASIFEQVAGPVLARRSPSSTIAAALAASAFACLVDYSVTPQRLRPGYEKRVSPTALALLYAALGVGLAAGALWNRRARKA
jgi:tetrahydromethanopterin S-methyltransferase subunit C